MSSSASSPFSISLLSALEDAEAEEEEEAEAFRDFEEAGSELAFATAERRRHEAAAQRWARCGDPADTARKATSLLRSLAASEHAKSTEAALVSAMAREAVLEEKLRRAAAVEGDLRRSCQELRSEVKSAAAVAAATTTTTTTRCRSTWTRPRSRACSTTSWPQTE